jgi:hypothetical protein
MMFKIRQGLTVQQSLKHPGLVSRFLQGHQVLNLTEGHHPLDPLLWTFHPSLKISNCQEYLEDGLSGSMRNSNLIHSELSVSDPSSSPCKVKVWKEGLLRTKEFNEVEYLENIFMAIVHIDLAQKKYDHIALC